MDLSLRKIFKASSAIVKKEGNKSEFLRVTFFSKNTLLKTKKTKKGFYKRLFHLEKFEILA